MTFFQYAILAVGVIIILIGFRALSLLDKILLQLFVLPHEVISEWKDFIRPGKGRED
jgi:hypothetical protein